MKKTNQRFIETVMEYYAVHGREHLPWRKTRNSYRILVSEIMLQQTQVDRVIPKYRAFLKAFPTVSALARAPLSDVLCYWQGLGYNRRAKMLHACAKCIASEHHGRFPRTYEQLVALPGVGPYTAGAVLAFAFDVAVPLVETNIRSAYIYHFFQKKDAVTDAVVLAKVAETLNDTPPHIWYAALMDYGVYIKQTHGNQNVTSAHYAKQSTFQGSDRQIRGAVIRHLLTQRATKRALEKVLPFDRSRITVQLERLLDEGLIIKTRSIYSLPR